MSIGIHTNHSAAIAHQNLSRTQSEMKEVQTRIATGLKVNGAKDNGAIYAIAQKHRSQISSYSAVTNSMNLAIATTEVALAGAQSVNDLMVEMRSLALAATDTSLDGSSRAALNEDFKALLAQTETIVQNASFNGKNLLNGTTDGVFPVTSIDGSAASVISVYDYPMQFGGTHSWVPQNQEINTSANANTALSQIDTALNGQGIILRSFGNWINRLEKSRDLANTISSKLESGLGNMIDADMGRESARLQALQIKSQLGVQTLSIANQSSKIALSLFQ